MAQHRFHDRPRAIRDTPGLVRRGTLDREFSALGNGISNAAWQCGSSVNVLRGLFGCGAYQRHGCLLNG